MFAFNSFAADDIINVGLYYGSGVLQTVSIASGDGLVSPSFDKLGTDITAKFNSTDNSIELYENTTNVMLYKTKADEYISINGTGNITKVNGVRYRGIINLCPSSGGIMVINQISIEEYLYGVVPKEAVASWPVEALKAQAVAARTYVYSGLKNKHATYGFDVCATTNCQVYGGYDAEYESTNKAVDDTKGVIALYKGQAVHTLFCSGNGGWAEDSKNVWGGSYPYLVSFKDEYEETDSIKGLVWTASVTPKEIAEGVAKYGGNVGTVTSMNIIETAESGRVLKLKVTGTEGSFVLEKEKARTFLGLRSSLYTITPPAPNAYVLTSSGTKEVPGSAYVLTSSGTTKISSTPTVLSSNGKYTLPPSDGDYIISGRGYGHGVGMSQWGAYCMSEQGFKYDEILKYYYKGITLGTINDLN